MPALHQGARALSGRALLAFIALSLIWGIPYLLIKLAVAELSPLVIAWGRVTLGTCVLLPIAWRRGALEGIGKHRGALLAFALVEFVIPFSAIGLGERWVSSSVTGILIATVPLAVALLSRWFGVHEPLTARRITGLVLGLAGVACLLGLGTIGGALGWLGVACMLIAAFGYAIGPLIIERYFKDLGTSGPLAASLAVSSVLLTVPAWLARPPQSPTPLALGAVLVLGLVCTALAMLLLFYLVASAGPGRATLITYFNPAVATLLGIALLHEQIGIGGGIGFAMILAGSWLASRRASPGAGQAPGGGSV